MQSDRKQSLRTDQDFDDFYRLWHEDLRRIASAYAYRFSAGWSSDGFAEAYSAVNMVWWNALQHWTPGRPFGVYFWSMWRNHMASTGRAQIADKRPKEISTTDDITNLDDPVSALHHLTYTDDPTEHLVIGMLALGYRPTEVSSVVGRRTYYRVIEEWKDNYLQEQGS